MKVALVSSHISRGAVASASLFAILKGLHVIAWSWWWVATPLWAPFAVLAAAFLAWSLAGCIRLVVLVCDGIARGRPL
jgi:hypothetical protein